MKTLNGGIDYLVNICDVWQCSIVNECMNVWFIRWNLSENVRNVSELMNQYMQTLNARMYDDSMP